MKKKAIIVRRFMDIVYLTACNLLLFTANNVYADDIKRVLSKTAALLKFAATTLGPGIGILLCLSGILKIRKKDEDPREFSKGVLYIVSGIMATIAGLIIKWVLSYYDADTGGGILNFNIGVNI